MGSSGASMVKWDWHEKTLATIIRGALVAQKEIYPQLDVDKAFDEVYAVRKDRKIMKYLDKHYPFFDDRT